MTDKDPCITWGRDAVCISLSFNQTTYRDGRQHILIIEHLPAGFTDSSFSHNIKTTAHYCMMTNDRVKEGSWS